MHAVLRISCGAWALAALVCAQDQRAPATAAASLAPAEKSAPAEKNLFDTPEGIELAVTDEGIGVPPSERDRIFSKFYKAGDGHGRGTGLGLFIAQGLVQEMGGKIRVDSPEGGGSRFTFALPRAQPMGDFRAAEA